MKATLPDTLKLDSRVLVERDGAQPEPRTTDEAATLVGVISGIEWLVQRMGPGRRCPAAWISLRGVHFAPFSHALQWLGAVIGAIAASMLLRMADPSAAARLHPAILSYLVLSILVTPLAPRATHRILLRHLIPLGCACGAAFLGSILLVSSAPATVWPLAGQALVVLLFSWGGKILMWRLIQVIPPIRMVVVGAGACARDFMAEVGDLHGFAVEAVFDDNPSTWGATVAGQVVRGPTNTLPVYVLTRRIPLIVVATENGDPGLVDRLIACRYAGVRIYDSATAWNNIIGRVPVQHVSADWIAMVWRAGPSHGRIAAAFRRLLDLLLAACGLVLAAPLLAIAALAIRLDSAGPALFKQRRVGLHGGTFDMWKLRSMQLDAEEGVGPAWATEYDPRVTRVGRILRRLRIDEVPQLWNVLRGEMSIVGPRPERPEFVQMLSKRVPYFQLRHAVKPGLTGWAQVSLPYAASVSDALRKLECDLYYIQRGSLLFDLRIIAQTVFTVLRCEGSR